MGGMYPTNQEIEIFGEQVSWPGVDGNGKFTNGSFTDPMVKPSFIPADTLNLILDNLEGLIAKCGGTPNATGIKQLADLATSLAQEKRLVMRDAHGRAQVAAPEADNDIIRKGDVTGLLAALEERISEGIGESLAGAVAGAVATPFGWGHVTDGRNLLEVLGVDTVAEAVETLHRKINADGVPDFSGLQIGDYLDLPSLDDGTTVYTWNEAYKNLRVVISGFNTYKHASSKENVKNHIVFTFENCPLTKRMNATGDNTGGYPASELKTYLEGGFLTGLVAALGHDYMYAVERLISNKSGNAWLAAKIFPPTEIEVYGVQCFGDELGTDASPKSNMPIQLPIFRDSYKHRIKRYNGSRQLWWLSTPYSGGSASFCNVNNNGNTNNNGASSAGGVAPDSVSHAKCRAGHAMRMAV